MQVHGRVAIVTGASNGIGLATARLLTKKGARVALVARSKDKLERLATELPGSLAVVADLSDIEQVNDMVKDVHEHYGTVDILVNNAGRGYDATIEHMDLSALRSVIELDMISPISAMQAVIPIMAAQHNGVIVNISSGTALMHLPNMGGYAATKAALTHLSLTAREELKDKGITVSVVYPYITDTNFEANTIMGAVDASLYRRGNSVLHEADTAEYVAELVIQAIESGAAEVVAHDWMKR